MPARARKKSARKSTKAKILSSKIVYKGPVFYVSSDQVREPSGVVVRRDVIRHLGSTVILAADDSAPQPRVLLIKQYRHAAQEFLWELPAGRIDEGETALVAAKRELIEETGYRAHNWKKALFFYVSPGFLDETMTIFLATGLEEGDAEPEEDEAIDIEFFPLRDAVRMALTGKIKDAKTIAGILWLDKHK